MRKINLIAIVLLIAVAVAGFYYYQTNIYSKEVLKLEILGQNNADLLQEVEYVVKYKNNGNSRLEEPELVFEYPGHAIPTGETSLRVTKTSKDFGDAIYPGEEKTFTFKARLLGKEGEVLTAKATMTYRPKNLKARYESSTTFTTIIQKVPLTFEFDLPSKIESGKQLTFRLNYFSNIDYPITGLRITAEYPSNFEFVESAPQSLEKTEWDVGVLNKANGGRISITGRLSGDVGEEKVFSGKIGIWKDGEFILLKEATKALSLIDPSLYLSKTINGNPQYVASPGDSLHYQISFKNIGEDMLNNLFLIAKLEGKAFDFETLKAPYGEFSSGDNSIVFDWKNVSKLQFLDGQEEGEVEFWINLKDEWPILNADDKNAFIKDSVYLSQAKEEFTNKVNSKLVVEQKGFFNDEVFGNSGSIPPKVGEITTYTIMWNVKNYYNDVNNVKVKAKLPTNVELTGKMFPEDQSSKFAFDSQSREIVWEVGDLKMSQGVDGTLSPNISFQVRFTPFGDQRGTIPEIISEAEISGQDQWTGKNLISKASGLTTMMPDDKNMTVEMGTVR
jgi:hypothetical protein